MLQIIRLYFEFFKIGLFSIGGGLATYPFLQDLADTTGWFTRGDLANMLAVSESTPGPMGVNMATYVGYECGGIAGGIVATLGLVTPSIIIIILVALFLKRFKENKYVQAVFYGIRPASTGLIAASGLSVALIALLYEKQYKETGVISDLFNYKSIILAVIILIFSRYVKPTMGLHPIIFIACSAVVGILFHMAGV